MNKLKKSLTVCVCPVKADVFVDSEATDCPG